MPRYVFTILGAGILALSLSITGCGRNRIMVTMAGSTAFQPFAEKLAEEFMMNRADVSVTVQGGGSAVGIQSALSGAAQIGMADLVNLPPEAAELSKTVVARDGIVIVVNPANPTANLTMEQIRAIFNGTSANWKEFGGPDKPIVVVSREAGSGTRSSFEQIVKDIKLTGNAIIQDSNGTIRETVANDANAIGYLSHGLLNEKIKALSVGGESCTTASVLANRYPLVRPVYLLTRGAPQGAAKDVIDFMTSAQGQKIIQDSGLLPAK